MMKVMQEVSPVLFFRWKPKHTWKEYSFIWDHLVRGMGRSGSLVSKLAVEYPVIRNMFPLPEFPSETVGLWKMLHCCQQSLSTPPKPSWSLLDFSPCTNAGSCLKTGTDCENCNPPVISKVKNTCSQIDLHLTFGYLNLFFSKIQMTFHSAQKAHNMSSFDNVAESHVSGAHHSIISHLLTQN